MRNFKLTIEYDGTDFRGWQIQNPRHRTVQGEIERVLKKIFKRKIRMIGSGRTDSGVHALGQVAHFKVHSTMTTTQILKAMNSLLPKDIAILKVEEVSSQFHSQYSVRRKTYRYTILNRPIRSVFQKNFCLYFPYQLNLRLMRNEAKSLMGRKNFRSFMANSTSQKQSSQRKDTIRRIFKVDIKRSKNFLFVEIEGDGFLYKMVRNIVGTLLKIGTGKLPQGSIKRILKEKNRRLVGPPSPARGLCLMKTTY